MFKAQIIGLLFVPLITLSQEPPSAATTASPPPPIDKTSGYVEKGTPNPKLGYSSVYVEGPYVAITFDDGPHATQTPRLLNMLAERKIKATFFVLGECVQQNPQILKRIADEGHEIGNHSWSHASFAKLSKGGVLSEIERCQQAIISVTGKPATLLRPPYGAITHAQREWITNELGMKIILWSLDPLDWKYRDSGRVQQQIVNQIKNGAIILGHDIHPTTISAMPGTLDTLIAKGFKFLTVSELLAMEKPRPTKTTGTSAAVPQAP